MVFLIGNIVLKGKNTLQSFYIYLIIVKKKYLKIWHFFVFFNRKNSIIGMGFVIRGVNSQQFQQRVLLVCIHFKDFICLFPL